MEKIDSIDLQSLLQDTTEEVIKEKKNSIIGFIKGLLSQKESLQKDLKKLNNDIKKIEENITKIDEKLEKIKNNDWSIIQEKGKNDKKN